MLNGAVCGVGYRGLKVLTRVGHETIAIVGHDGENERGRTAYSRTMEMGDRKKGRVGLRRVEGLVWDEKVVVDVAVGRKAKPGSGIYVVCSNEAVTSVQARSGVATGEARRLVNIVLLAQGRIDA